MSIPIAGLPLAYSSPVVEDLLTTPATGVRARQPPRNVLPRVGNGHAAIDIEHIARRL